MIFKPVQLGKESFSREELAADKKACRKFGPCGVGKQALYLNTFYFDRFYYVAISSVTRVFKRVAMSKGGYTGKGAFASMPYLVVVYDDGKEKQCNFKYEEQVDQMIAYICKANPRIKSVSEAAESRLQAQTEEEKRYRESLPELSDTAKAEVEELGRIQTFLEKRPALFSELSNASRKKRTYERTSPAYKWVALIVTILGAVVLAYGIYSFFHDGQFGVYFMLFGLAALFLFSGAHVLPTAKNNRRAIENRLEAAIRAVEAYIKGYPDFPLPAYYTHPMTVKRMITVIREGRAETAEQALEVVKEDLKRLNADVQVSQEEHDEVVAIKPMFLVMNYK